uniref:Uncharacterized protein n=1 Tax=Glossina austeni TaxID=7395 RepID=A0A1A9VNB8_GLOAU
MRCSPTGQRCIADQRIGYMGATMSHVDAVQHAAQRLSYGGYGHLIEENIKYAVAIISFHLQVKALVCDRSAQNRRTARDCAGYHIERADGSKYIVAQMYDYIHIIDAFYSKMSDTKELYDVTIVRKLAARKATFWQHWKTRGAKMLVGTGRSLKDIMQLFTTAAVAMLKIAIKKGFIGSEKEIRSYEVFAAMTKLSTILHSGKISRTNWQAQQAVLEEVVEFSNKLRIVVKKQWEIENCYAKALVN